MSVTVRRRNNDEEHRIQTAFVSWFRMQYGRRYPKALFAIPNGGKLSGEGAFGKAARSETERARNAAIKGKKLKDEGLEPGAADLFLSIPSGEYNGMYIETKTATGKQSDEQKKFEQAQIERGYAYVIMRSPDHGIAITTAYLEGFFNQKKHNDQCQKLGNSTQKPKAKKAVPVKPRRIK